MTIILGELSREEDVLEWLVENKSTGDDEEVIEDVTAKTLNTLIGNIDSLAVLFCESPQITFFFCWSNKDNAVAWRPFADDHGVEESMLVLEELEKIDDECDKHGVQFVKIDDERTAKEYGIDDLPAIVYFEKQVPTVYGGELDNEEEILTWLVSQLEKDEIEDVTDEMLDKMVKEGRTLAVLFCE